jgi:hypothetical protein
MTEPLTRRAVFARVTTAVAVAFAASKASAHGVSAEAVNSAHRDILADMTAGIQGRPLTIGELPSHTHSYLDGGPHGHPIQYPNQHGHTGVYDGYFYPR